MQPQPLLRVLAHPSFDDRRDDLRGGLHVDAAVAVAHRRDLPGELGAEAMAGLMSGEPCRPLPRLSSNGFANIPNNGCGCIAGGGNAADRGGLDFPGGPI